MVGTVRRDGWPRLSPVEPDIAAGHLLLGMMWRSGKALDLLCDPRCTVHSVPSSRTNPGGDVKLYGRASDVQDAGLRAAYRAAIKARIDWEPTEPEYHLFSVEVESAVVIRFDDEGTMETWRWSPADGLRTSERPAG